MNTLKQLCALGITVLAIQMPLAHARYDVLAGEQYRPLSNPPGSPLSSPKSSPKSSLEFTLAADRYVLIGNEGSRPVRGVTALASRLPAPSAFDPPLALTAGLPHLRMDLRVTSVQLIGEVLGDTNDFVVETYLSTDAHVENAGSPGDRPRVPTPYQDNHTITLDNVILSALVYDGCDSSTVINVTSAGVQYDSPVGAYLWSTVTDGPVDTVFLEDSVQGPGFYEFSFSFHFDDHQWIVSGDAPVYCTAGIAPLPLD